MRKAPRPLSAIVLGSVAAILGALFAKSGVRVVLQWDVISRDYALCGLLWLLAGAAMVVAGIWAAFLPRRARLPLWIASRATVIAGATALIGTLTYVIPCAGPS